MVVTEVWSGMLEVVVVAALELAAAKLELEAGGVPVGTFLVRRSH